MYIYVYVRVYCAIAQRFEVFLWVVLCCRYKEVHACELSPIAGCQESLGQGEEADLKICPIELSTCLRVVSVRIYVLGFVGPYAMNWTLTRVNVCLAMFYAMFLLDKEGG